MTAERAGSALRRSARRLLPFAVRLEVVRWRRMPRWLLERPGIARRHATAAEVSQFTHLLAAHRSPLERVPGAVAAGLQRGKETNVRLATARIDRLVVEPFSIYSHHHTIGRPSRRRGFRRGLELRDGQPSAEVGGGLCQVSNSFHWVALRAGMRIVERHRHGLDLFPDHLRTVPFGGGATVVYNYADLRFENPLPQPVLLSARVEEGELVAEIRTTSDPGWRAEVYEVDHRFIPEGDGWARENRIRRRFLHPSGRVLLDQEVAHNRGRVAYAPPTACGEG